MDTQELIDLIQAQVTLANGYLSDADLNSYEGCLILIYGLIIQNVTKAKLPGTSSTVGEPAEQKPVSEE